MAIFQALQELSDAWLIFILILNLVFFAYLAFRLGRDRDLFGLDRENRTLEPSAVRVDPPGFWRERE